MRSRSSAIALILAVIFGLIGTGMAFKQLNKPEGEGGSSIDLATVVVAAMDLPFGTQIETPHIRTAQYPADSVPEGAFRDPDSLIGHTTKVFVCAREPILGTKLSTEGGGLSVRIPENMRAISINVNIASGVSGFVLPGDRVDVLVIIDQSGRTSGAVTRTILQDVEVVASGPQVEARGKEPLSVQSVTLLVDPMGAAKLALALHEGKLHLVLRNPGDRGTASAKPIKTPEILRDETAPVKRWRPPPKPKEPEVGPVNIWKGSEKTVETPPVP